MLSKIHILLLLAALYLCNANGAAKAVGSFFVNVGGQTVDFGEKIYDKGTEVTGNALNEVANIIVEGKKKINNLIEEIQDRNYVVVQGARPWITQNYERLKKMKLSQMVFAATHDAGCYDLS
jgi:hypothetical protein